MKKIIIVQVVVLTLCGISLTSCSEKKDMPVNPQPGEKRYVMAEMTESSDEAIIKHYFTYDKEGRLTQVRLQQSFSDEQQNTDDILKFIYDGNLITQMSTIQEKDFLFHLNADGLLEDYEYYNYPTDDNLHFLYTYDDAHRMMEVNEYGMIMRTLTWEGDEVVKIVESLNGEVTETITIEPSEVETPGFYPRDLTGSVKSFYTLMGFYGKMPKHLPATWSSTSKAEIGTIQVFSNYTYTVTNGLLVECVEEKETDIDLNFFVQKTNETIKYTYTWKEL